MAKLELKICMKCNKEKIFPENFHKHGKKKDGSYYYHNCKQITDNNKEI